ncbi:hypothetical protein KUTeg_004205 [Tegillarca granosa]|uniref:N-acetylneuraminate lyase n=1 Tax=Tegillarca granosa TaxID=220873 RepID=A0ABQ9FPA6_TEGGR|nr:hypothetical protein KUTeg_004205 [Tegillarca granosa]
MKHSSREIPNAYACSLVDKKFQVLMGTDVASIFCFRFSDELCRIGFLFLFLNYLCNYLNHATMQFLPYLSLNMEVPVTAPFMGDLFFQLKTLFDKGDLDGARKYQEKAQVINTIRGKYGGGINVAKSIFKIVTGINAGSVRLPLTQLTKEQEENLKNDLDASDAFKL